MSKVIAFGIAAFHFGLKGTSKLKITGQQYIVELRKSLESMPSVSNIMISAPDEFNELSFENMDEEKYNDSYDFPPAATYLDISFELYIPKIVF